MRRVLLVRAAIAFAIACTDNFTEPTPDRPLATAGTASRAGTVAFATTTTEDGLSISTDKDDYQPGDIVHLTGAGWQAGDVLDILLVDNPQTHDPLAWSVDVAADGMFHDSTYVVDAGDLDVAFTLTATSRATGRSLTVQFTDANINNNGVVVSPASVTVTAGNTATYSVAVSFGGNDTPCTSPLSATGLPTGAVATFNPTSVTGIKDETKTSVLTITTTSTTPAGTRTITVTAGTGTGCTGNPRSGTTVLVVQANSPANTPATLEQFRSNGTTSIPTGGATNETSVVLKGVVSDPNAGNTVKLQVEVKPVGTPFTNVATAESALLASGSTAAVTVGSLVNGTSYHWQARAEDNNGAASPWVSFGGNAETAADFLVDTDAPGVTINQAAAQADPTKNSPINFTVVFSKPVTGFATGDVTLSGTAGATTATVTGSGTTYNVAVSGMTTDGTVIATIAAGVATDAAGNANVASTSTDNSVTYDTTKPTVTINQAATQADPTNASPINFTVVFSEIVTGFATGDVTLSGTAGATTATVSGSGTTYNVAVAGMTTDGTVIASIAAGVATDGATNTNVVSTSTDNSVTYDKTPPTVTINQAAGQADPTKVSPINFTVVFNETVTDFATGDITLSGTAGATTATVTGSGMTYNVAVSGMANNGTVIASIAEGVAHDAAGNDNLASTSTDHTVTYDPDPPVVSDVAVSPSPTNGTINVTATAKVDDATTGNSKIVSAEYSIDGGAPVAMAASDGTFNSATENVTASIPAAVVAALSNGTHQVCVRGTDAAGNMSSFSDAGACATLTVDKDPPVVSNVAVAPSPTNGTIAVTATAKVDDAATGNSKIVSAVYRIDAGAEIAMTASDGSFSSATENVTATIPAATVAALSNGNHTVCIKGTDAAGNTSSFADAGACATLTVDKEPPVVSNVVVSPNPTNGTINVTATATVDDAATGNSDVVSAYYRIDAGSPVAMTASDGSFNSATENVTATIPAAALAALSNGTHTVCVRGTDAAGNTSLFSAADACTNLIIDKEPPLVSNVSVSPNPTNGSIAVTATAKVDDATTGNSKITSAYYKIDGAAEVAMAASDATFDEPTENVTATIPAATVLALNEGDHQVCVRGTDAAGNTSSFADAGACTTLTIDKTPPEVTINQASGQADPTNASPINFTVVFNETVTDFATGDVALSGTAGATTATVTGSGMTYNVAVSGMTGDGTVIATVAAGVAHDAAGNGNKASTSTDNTVTYDITPPKVTINQAVAQADPTKASPINFTVIFDETVTGFATGDVTLSGTAGATTATVTGSGLTYNVAVSGMTGNGTVIATVAAGVAKDAAGNNNEASTSTDNTVTYDTTPPAISNFNINPNPVAVNTLFTISATFTDALSFVTGAEYSLDGGPWTNLPAAGSTAPYGDSKTENGSITISRTNADVVNVCVRSTDQASNTNQATGTNPIQCAFLAVYDPSAGFVTGGGWINSPAGAYRPDLSLTGKANFGFVSKYLKGANTPTGNTEFQFHAGSLNFSSTVYEWLVVQGQNKASYKGSGTVNGASGYGFLLSVIDNGPSGDKFRMKIWNKTTGAIVYDNQFGAADDASAAQYIDAGNIVIHTTGGVASK